MRKKVLAAALACAVMIFPFTGCGVSDTNPNAGSSGSSSSVSASVEKEPELRTLGTETADAYSVKLTNATDQDITAIKVGTSDDINSAENLLSGQSSYENGETVKLYYTPADTQTDSSAGSSDKELTPEYELSLTLADGSEHILHSFPFGDIDEGNLEYQDGTVYLTYVSVSTNETVNTLEAEKAVADQKAQEKAQAASGNSSSGSSKSFENSSTNSSSNQSGTGSSGNSSSSGNSHSSSSTRRSGSSTGSNSSGTQRHSGSGSSNGNSSGNSSGSTGSTGGSTGSGDSGSEDSCVGDGLTY